ncbi:MAG: N-acetylmuramoyl-L-alanine amidase [Christensenellaceae bacterium]|jgi:N-acetylmuramoyl-L-alanine amidase|nr:N-acetylmuramoyl-L-alanine amidase [Christensenellaceae bacterium]
MFLVLKKRILIIAIVALFLCALSVGTTIWVAVAIPKPDYTVILDAGHGGADAGVIGVNSKIKESTMNLIITENVKKYLVDFGVRVVLTRSDENGLYGSEITNQKKLDMRRRKEKILSTVPDLVVSIHCNKFPDKERRGAQVFFDNSKASGMLLASMLQMNLNALNLTHIGHALKALSGDYYMLKCSNFPSALVECGFLSNVDDDALLNDSTYRDKLSYAIATAIFSFLTNEQIK